MTYYNLEDVKEVAANIDNIFYKGRNVRRDIENLGYTRQDISNCICSLTHENFYKKESHNNKNDNKNNLDAYKITYHKMMDGELKVDYLYIKFRLNNKGKLIIQISSFHLSR